MIERILSKVPAHWLVFFASWGLWAYDTYGSVSKQFWRTYSALMGSFMEEIVGWPLDSPYPIVLTDYYSRGPYFYGAEYYTKFNITQRQILFVDQSKPHQYEQWKNPYLALSVLENGQEILNLSDWIETVKVYSYKDSEYFVPLHILLLCYAYEQGIALKHSDSFKYQFSVVTMTGDIETLDIRGKKVVIPVEPKEECAPGTETEADTTT